MRNILIITLALTCFFNCSEMNDLHQQYLDQGEAIHPAKPDSLISFSGDNRIKLQWFVYSDLSIKKARIFWNDNVDSLDVSIAVTPSVTDTVSAIIENLPEGGYIFEVSNLDAFGNKSIPVTRTGKSLGDIYKSSLNNRSILTHRITEGNDSIVFFMSSSSPADYIDTEFKFFDTNNVEQELKLSDDNLFRLGVPLDDIDISKNIEYRTVFQPFGNAVDLFYTDYSEFVIE